MCWTEKNNFFIWTNAMFVPLLNKSFNLSTVEKFIGDISATTYWIDYLVDMATKVVLCHAGLSVAWRVILGIWEVRHARYRTANQQLQVCCRSTYCMSVGSAYRECTRECMNEWMNELNYPPFVGAKCLHFRLTNMANYHLHIPT